MNIFASLFSEFAVNVLSDDRVLNSAEVHLYRNAGYLSGWTASKLEYAARSLRRQEQAFHALAERSKLEAVLPVPRNNKRVTRARELTNLISECWKE